MLEMGMIRKKAGTPPRPTSFEFRTGMTKHLLVLVIAVVVVSAFLLIQGIWVNRTWVGTHRGDLFLAMSGILPLGLAGALWKYMLGRSVELNPKAFVLKEGNSELQIPWTQAVYHPSAGRFEMFHRCMVCDVDGEAIEVYRMFYPQYDEIVKQVEAIIEYLSKSASHDSV